MNTFLRNAISKLHNAVSVLVAATRYTLTERLTSVRETASSLYNRMVENMGYGQETLKDIVEKEAEKDIDLTRHEHERELTGAYRSFLMPGLPKTDIDSYFDQSKPYIKTLVETYIKTLIAKGGGVMTLWVIWKNAIKLLIEGPKDAKSAQELRDGTTDDIYYEKTEMLFNSVMTDS